MENNLIKSCMCLTKKQTKKKVQAVFRVSRNFFCNACDLRKIVAQGNVNRSKHMYL